VTAADVKAVATKYLTLANSVTGYLVPQPADEGADKTRKESRQ